MGLPFERVGIGVDMGMEASHGNAGNGRVEQFEGLRDAVRDIMTMREWQCLMSLSDVTKKEVEEGARWSRWSGARGHMVQRQEPERARDSTATGPESGNAYDEMGRRVHNPNLVCFKCGHKGHPQVKCMAFGKYLQCERCGDSGSHNTGTVNCPWFKTKVERSKSWRERDDVNEAMSHKGREIGAHLGAGRHRPQTQSRATKTYANVIKASQPSGAALI